MDSSECFFDFESTDIDGGKFELKGAKATLIVNVASK